MPVWVLFSILLEIFLFVPVYKKERSDPGNYRPISLFPLMSKILESFANDRISKYLEGTGLFSDLYSMILELLDPLLIYWLS